MITPSAAFAETELQIAGLTRTHPSGESPSGRRHFEHGATPAPGTLIASRYTVESVLGEGGFGVVLSCRDELAEGRPRVALKVLHASSDDVVLRLKRRELEVLRRVHARSLEPNVVRPLHDDLLDYDGRAVLALELVDGPSLAELLVKERVLDQAEVRAIATGIASGLAAIHRAGGVHRDLKPPNILLRDGQHAVILDLGIAQAMWSTGSLTTTGQALMTPLYASPEQLRGGEVGSASDIYSFGLLCFEMLTGTVPLSGHDIAELAIARNTVLSPPDPRPLRQSVSDKLRMVTMRCLARDPAERPTAQQIAEVLSDTRPVALPEPARARSSWARRGGALALLVAGGATLWMFGRSPSLDVSGRAAALASSPPPSAILDMPLKEATPGTGETKPSTTIEQDPSTPHSVVGSGARSVNREASPSATAASDKMVGPAPATVVSVSDVSTTTASAEAPACEAGQTPSNGHCCPVGKTYKNGVCRRPL
ncbi:MAG: protein kinase [Polyangiaceae bacterium]|nr:protein kinase [Polyangiaceae bacterium]